MIHKLLGGVFTLFFLFAAVVQFNDPDSLLWVLLYFIAALASVMFFLGKLKFWMVAVLIPVYAVLAFVHWPPEFEGVALQDGMKTLNIELARESLGMGISALIMVVYALVLRRKKN